MRKREKIRYLKLAIKAFTEPIDHITKQIEGFYAINGAGFCNYFGRVHGLNKEEIREIIDRDHMSVWGHWWIPRQNKVDEDAPDKRRINFALKRIAQLERGEK